MRLICEIRLMNCNMYLLIPSESRSVQIVSNLPDHITDSDGVLEFSKVGMDDGGRYTCVATSQKRVINATITLTVVVKPKFSVKPQNTTVKEGESVLIDCAAEGDPTPTISVSACCGGCCLYSEVIWFNKT